MSRKFVTGENSYELLNATINALNEGIIVLSEESLVRHFNLRAEKLFGYKSSEVLGHSVDLLIPSFLSNHNHDLADNLSRYKKSKTRNEVRHTKALTRSGELFSINLSVRSIKTRKGILLVCMVREIGPKEVARQNQQDKDNSRTLYKSLNQINVSSVLSELVRSIAHEINQPLTAITTYADVSRRLIREDSITVEAIEQTLNKISQQAIRTSHLIINLRRLSIQSVLPRYISSVKDLMNEIKDVINSEAKQAGCRISWFIEENLPKISVAPAQIQHVLILLLRNSLDSVTLQGSKNPEIQVRAKRSDDWIEFSVQDYGTGVSSDFADILFHPFTSSNSTKLGLGLPICKTIVDDHGGQIWHDPNITVPCRFIFTIPIYQPDVQELQETE